MRLPYVLILLAVATRPVDVGAHADPSDIVTTDGRVQRHLRVHEHTPDKDNDDDERTFPSVEEIVSPNAIDKAADMLDLTILDYDLSGASDNVISNFGARKRPADKTLESANKKIKNEFSLVNEILADLYSARSQNMQLNQGEMPKKNFKEIMLKARRDYWGRTFKGINTLLLNGNETPQEVFALYQLNFAYDTFFQQTQLQYWVNYLDVYNAKMSSKESLYVALKKHYDDTTLVVALANALRIRSLQAIKKRVKKELKDSWIKAQVTPVDAFTRLNLKEVDNNIALSTFWAKYFVYYNGHVGINDKVLMASLLKQPYLLKFFSFIKRSTSIKQLERDVKNVQLNIWNDANTSDEEMRQTVEEVEGTDSVYAFAVKKALRSHQKLQIRLSKLLQEINRQ